MGDWKRPVLYSVGLAGAIAAAAMPWWTVGGGAWTPRLEIGLSSWTMCHESDCMKVPVTGGFYAGAAWTTLILAAMTALGCFGAAFLSFVERLPDWLPKRVAAIAGALMGSAALTWFALDPPPGVHPSPSWGVLGCALAVLAGLVGAALDFTFEHAETETLATARVVAMPPSAEPRKVLAGTVDLQRAVDAATRPTQGNKVASRGSSKAAVDAMRETLRFVVDTGSFDAHAIHVRTTDGDERTIPWIDLDKVVARRLPPDPPFEKTLLVDLVPRDGKPLRLLQSTRLDWRSLPGGAATTARENLRRLVAHAQACHPALVIDPASEPFVLRGAEPPQLGSARLVAEYDAAYG
jgi:hypothetical protein